MSGRLTPAAVTRISTSCGPGRGTGPVPRVSTSGPPGPAMSIKRIDCGSGPVMALLSRGSARRGGAAVDDREAAQHVHRLAQLLVAGGADIAGRDGRLIAFRRGRGGVRVLVRSLVGGAGGPRLVGGASLALGVLQRAA